MIPVLSDTVSLTLAILIIICLSLSIVILLFFHRTLMRQSKHHERILKHALTDLKKKEEIALHQAEELEKSKAALLNIMEDLTESYEQLKELDKMKSDFVTNVSHELRTPITSIALSLDILEKEKDLKKRNEMLQLLHRNVHRLNRTINNILDFSAAEAGKFTLERKIFQLNDSITQIVEELKPVAEAKGIRLETTLFSRSKIKGDREWLTRAIMNVVDNSIKFTDKGYVKISLKQEKNYIILVIKDSGRGIRQRDIPHIFDKFTKLEKHIPGTGVGLWITKRTIEDHKGTIQVTSKRKKGSTFTIRLPKGVKQ